MTDTRKRTKDKGHFYTTEDIGEKRSYTPEGFLVCHDVPIARTGTQLYMSEEVPVEDAGNGEVRISRLPEEVFRAETIASFEGKAVTVEHPNDFVTPDNWQQLAVGTVQNVRRGEGLQDDLLIADLVITDKAAIEYVNKSLPEVSAGYEATYEQEEPGRGVQRDIVGNHVALVERGRAGPRCSIQDGEPTMKKGSKKQSFLDRLKAFLDSEAEEMKAEEKAEDAEGEEGTEGENKTENKDENSVEERLARIEAVLAKLVPVEEAEHGESFDEDGEEGKKDEEGEETADDVLEAEEAETNSEAVGTVLSGDSLKQVIARAEILAPGSQFRTADGKTTVGAVAKFMRATLDKAMETEEGRKAVEPFLCGRETKSLTGDALKSVFTGAAELMRANNNAHAVRVASATKDFGRATSIADINARNREFWANRK